MEPTSIKGIKTLRYSDVFYPSIPKTLASVYTVTIPMC